MRLVFSFTSYMNLPIEFRTFDERIRIAVADVRLARVTAEALRMEFVIASYHHRTGDYLRDGRIHLRLANIKNTGSSLLSHLSALLARLAELGPVVVATEQPAVLLEVPAGQARIARRAAKAIGVPLLAERPYNAAAGTVSGRLRVQIVHAAGALGGRQMCGV